MNAVNKILMVALTAIMFVLTTALGTVVTVIGVVIGVVLRALPIILAVLVCVWVLTGCTYHTTIDNSVIDQSDVTQVLGCATDYGLLDD